MKKHLPHLKCRLILFAALSFAFAYSPAIAQTLQTNLPLTNGEVKAVLFDPDENIIYLGGNFTYVGPNTGHGVGIDNSTGNIVSGFPFVNGEIKAVVSDGSGGWYIGGSFTSVGGIVRNHIAHISADKSVDNSWNPNANDNVEAIAISTDGNTVYVGGYFNGINSIGGADRNNIAALNASTGNATDWNPDVNSNVLSLAVSGSTVYVGGGFNASISTPTIGGQTRNYIAAIDASTGNATSWDPNANNGVYALAVSGSTVYAGGGFTTFAGGTITRNYIAAIDASTGNATSWDPNADSYVSALAVSGSTIYAGGEFSSIGGQTRNFIAAIDASTGTATSWNPNADGGSLRALIVFGSTIYAGGYFTSIGGQTRNFIAAIDASTGTATSWNPNANGSVLALAISGSTVFAGGRFNSVGGQTRNYIAALDASTGNVTSWNPNANDLVRALAISGSTIYAGGNFTSIGGQPRNRIAAIDASTGNATGWNPNANSSVYALALSPDDNTVYAGGDFNTLWSGYSPPSIGDKNNNFIAAIDASSGSVSTWNPNANSTIYALAISADGNTVYVGGDFNIIWDDYSPPSIGGQNRNYIAAIDASSGNATTWDPNANNAVYALAVSGSTIYAGGEFSSIGGQSRNRIAAMDASTGNAATWNPNANSKVNALALSGSTVYTGGSFTNIGGQARNRIAALAADGTATSWDPNANNNVNAIALSVSNMKVYIGGSFSSVCGALTNNFAGMDNPGDAALPVELTSFTANIVDGKVTLNWNTATEVNNYGFEVQRTSPLPSPYQGEGGEAGRGWETIGFVQGNGNSNSPKLYLFEDKNPTSGKLQYRLKQIDFDGKYEYSDIVDVNIDAPAQFELAQNYPNPFNPTTAISYQLSAVSNVTLKIYDVLGREITTLVNGQQNAGVYNVVFDGGKYSSGVYFYRIDAVGNDNRNFTSIKKLVLMK